MIAQIQGQLAEPVPHLEALIEGKRVEKVLSRYAGNTLDAGGDPAKGTANRSGEIRGNE